MAVSELNRSWMYGILFIILVFIAYRFFISGLGELNESLETVNEEDYPRAVVLENLLSVKASTLELGYSYDRRRAVIPVEFFTRQANNGQPGFKKRTVNGEEHCYIPGVAGLDGRKYGFKVRAMYPQDKAADGSTIPEGEYRQLNCTELDIDLTKAVYAPALLVREAENNPKLPVRLYVYSIQ